MVAAWDTLGGIHYSPRSTSQEDGAIKKMPDIFTHRQNTLAFYLLCVWVSPLGEITII